MTDKKTFLWLLKIAGRYNNSIICLLFFQILVNGLGIYYTLIMKKMIDHAVGRNTEGFFTNLLIFALLSIGLIIFRIMLRQIEEFARSGMENNFKERLFVNLLKKNYGQVNAVHSEEWMNRMVSDTSVCATGMTDILPGFLGMSVRMIGALGMMFVLQPKLFYILIPGGIFFLGITFVLRKILKKYHKMVREKDGVLRVYVQEHISSMLVVRAFGVEEQTLKGAKNAFAEHKKVRMQKAIISNLCNTGFSLVINGMYLIGIGYCGYGILHGTVSYGTLIAIMQLIGQLQAPLSGISGFVPRFYTMLASAERLLELESYEDSNKENVKTLEEVNILYNEEIEKIVFDKVFFEYIKEDKTTAVLNDISLFVEKGDYVAITGTSGCGKSTLLKLLMGIYEPRSGVVCVEMNDGKRVSVSELRRLFAYVPQGNYLMGGTIRDIITFGKAEALQQGMSDMTIEKALKIACAEFVFELAEGLDTILGEKGAGLSEGQMQRIAIARALYADTPVLILDEATSALDVRTEKRLLCNLKHITDKTVFLVTHRLEALKICNRKVEFFHKADDISRVRCIGT